MSPPTPERPQREPDGTYRGDETDDLIDALIEAQAVNQAGFYAVSDNEATIAEYAKDKWAATKLCAFLVEVLDASPKPEGLVSRTVWAVVYSSYADDEVAGLYANEADARARVKELGGGMWEVAEWSIEGSFTPRDAASPEPPTP